MTPEDIKKLPTRETDSHNFAGLVGADICASLEQQRDALSLALQNVMNVWALKHTPDGFYGKQAEETLASIRQMKEGK